MKEIYHSMAIKVIGGYLNAAEYQNKEDANIITSQRLDESIFENATHKAVVRAINKVKDSGAEVCDLNVLEFLARYGIPRNINEETEILSIISEFCITPKSFNDHIKSLKLNRLSKVAV